MSADGKEQEYEYGGEWECGVCGETFEVEEKVDPLAEALSCPDHGGLGS